MLHSCSTVFMQPFRRPRHSVEHSLAILPALIFAGLVGALILFSGWGTVTVDIREALPSDQNAIWSILKPILRAAETYALPADLEQGEAIAYWFKPENRIFVVVQTEEVVGTYYLHANQQGGGAHPDDRSEIEVKALGKPLRSLAPDNGTP
jgi:hypothetical protein